jgi:hypothetical protein
MHAAPGARDSGRLSVATVAVAEPPPALSLRAALVDVRSAARYDLALLARPGPEGGPPPTLRAPPIG